MTKLLLVSLALLSPDTGEEIAKALAQAKRENRRVLLQWTSAKSEPCKALADLLKKDAELRKKLRYEYDVVPLEVGDLDRNMDLAKKYDADLSKGLPYLTVLSSDGKGVAQQEAAALSAKDLLAFLTKHQAEPKKADDLLKAGLKEAKDSKKRVFLIFGAPW